MAAGGELKLRGDGKPHVRRAKANVKHVYMLPLDIDGLMTIEEAKERFKEHEYFAYTSSGHKTARKNGGDAFRIFLPFSRPLTAKEYELRDEAFAEWMGSQLDQSSTDIARGFFFPSYVAADANNGHATWRNEGKLLDPDTFEEREEVAFTPAPIINTGITADKQNGAILWQTLDTVGLFKALGLYKTKGSDHRHEVVCPWLDEHTNRDESGTSIWELRADRKGDFNCQHGHCKGKRIFDVTSWVREQHGIDFIKPYVQVDTSDPGQKFIAEMRAKHERKDQKEADDSERGPPDEPEPEAESHEEAQARHVAEFAELDNDLAVEPFSRERRGELLVKKYRSSEKYLLLYASEGFGKSYLAAMIARRREEKEPNEFGATPEQPEIGGGKVVFACKSNVQAAEQAQGFLDQGLRVQMILARDYWLRENHKIESEYYEQSHPWDYERVNVKKTLRNMMAMGMTDQEIAELWDRYAPPAPDFANNDLIVTTQARVMGWGRIQRHRTALRFAGPTPYNPIPIDEAPINVRAVLEAMRRGEYVEEEVTPPSDVYEHLADVIPENVVIFCDDAHAEDFCQLRDFDNKFANKLINKKAIKVKQIGNFIYFVRPKEFLFGFGFEKNQIIFSTTELLTRELIWARYGAEKKQIEVIDADGKKKKETVGKVYTPKLMADGKLIGGKITMIKSNIVWEKNDGILPAIVERVRKLWPNKIEYIADGQGNKLNHLTAKGQNSFVDHDMIIELSHQHPGKELRYLHELGWEQEYKFALRVTFALDALHQAIGRNSGYRFSDRAEEAKREVVALVEPGIFNALMKYMRYQYTTAINLDDKETAYTRDDIGRDLPSTVVWYVKFKLQYIKERQGQLFIGDVRLALKSVDKRVARKNRLIKALKTMSTDEKSGITNDDRAFLERIREQVEEIPVANET